MSAWALLFARVLVALATVVCLLSMGGAMLFAWPVLVPLHWLFARRSGPLGTGFWTLLAALSMFEAGWMSAYALGAGEAPALLVGLVALVATAGGFLRRRADLVPV